MAIDPHLRILNGATSQADRTAGAPAPEAFEVDGRSLAELIAFAAPYGALINFFDLQNQESGDWGAFFASDPSVRLAMQAALDLPEIQHALQRELAKARDASVPERRLADIRRALTTINRLISVLDGNYTGPGDDEVQLRHAAANGRGGALAEPLQRYHRHVGNRSIAAQVGGAAEPPMADAGWGDALVEILEDIAVTLIGELRRGSAAALAALEASLHSEGHAPQAAVWNAFVMLFVEARQALNDFPQRLVHFYYNEVLQQHSLAPQPDQLFLAFTPAQASNQASVPRAAVFPAGADPGGTPITYTADATLEVTATAVKELSVHRMTTARLDADSANMKDAASGVLSGEVDLAPPSSGTIDPFPIFGEDHTGTFGPLKMKAATMGFSVASPTLMLAGGARKISIGLVVSQQSLASSHVASMAVELGTLAGVTTSEGLAEFVGALLTETLDVYYTTAGGWIKVEGFTVLPIGFGEATFVIGFDLPPDAPPLVSLATKPGPRAPDPAILLPADTFADPEQQPTVVGSLKSVATGSDAQKMWAAINKFAVVSRLEISEVTINVTVDGLTDLKLSTPNGPADTSQNFAVFGLPPAQHGALDISAPELFVKPINALSLTLDWAGLPVTKTGFSGYYQDYVLDADGAVSPVPLFDNASFRGQFSVVNPGPWTLDPWPSQPLFATTPPASPPVVAPGTLAVPAEPLPAAPVDQSVVLVAPVKALPAPPPYYNPATSALRLTLTEPLYAFGNVLYASNLMAASMAQGGAGSGVRVAGGGSGPSAAQLLAALGTANTATDKEYRGAVIAAADNAISALTGDALVAIRQAIATGGQPAAEQATLVASLDAALATAGEATGSLWSRLTSLGRKPEGASAVLANVSAWLADHQDAIGATATVPIKQAHAILDAASGLAAAEAIVASQPPAVARPSMAAAVQAAQTALLPPAIPNPPWLPMASGLSVSYAAAARFALGKPKESDDPSAIVSLAAAPPSALAASNQGQGTFLHIAPFDRVSTPPDDGPVQLLPRVNSDPALYILLSDPAPEISLLFILTAGPDGWWSDDRPKVIWEEHRADGWEPLTVLADGTRGLANSGIVRLALKPQEPHKTRLRIRAEGNTDKAPQVKAVIANALTASWAGPGGAAQLGLPLTAGTITKSETSLTNIGSIAQPMQSFGGRPPASGAGFQMWMAERLRHKNYAVDGWDYARLALQAEPSLWQVAVVPGTDPATGLTAPGYVWVVAVAGQNTPSVTDPTIPMADLTMLSDIGTMLEGSAGPFVQIKVTNPPYLRLKVTAEICFNADDTSEHWCIQLQKDLVKWLSPWPDPVFGPRPDAYYTKRAVSEFVRHRPYVHSIDKLDIAPEPGQPPQRWYYFTSSKEHDLSGETVRSADAAGSGM